MPHTHTPSIVTLSCDKVPHWLSGAEWDVSHSNTPRDIRSSGVTMICKVETKLAKNERSEIDHFQCLFIFVDFGKHYAPDFLQKTVLHFTLQWFILISTAAKVLEPPPVVNVMSL